MKHEKIIEGLTSEETFYEVWALGYDKDDCVTDTECFINTFTEAADAIAYVKSLDTAAITAIKNQLQAQAQKINKELTSIHIEVEAVIDTDSNGSTESAGTAFERQLSC